MMKIARSEDDDLDEDLSVDQYNATLWQSQTCFHPCFTWKRPRVWWCVHSSVFLLE